MGGVWRIFGSNVKLKLGELGRYAGGGLLRESNQDVTQKAVEYRQLISSSPRKKLTCQYPAEVINALLDL